MKCVRCSAEIPAQSQFCLRCGTPTHPTTTSPSGMMRPPVATPPSNNRALLITVSLLLLLVALLGAAVYKLTRKAQVVQAPAVTSNGGLVQAPAASRPSQLVTAPDESRPIKVPTAPTPAAPYPADIDDYLKFVKQIEARKKTLLHNQESDLIVMKDTLPADLMKKYMNFEEGNGGANDPANPQKAIVDLSKQSQEMATGWNQLTADFNRRQPPPSCVDLRNKYYDYLGKIQAKALQIYDVLISAQKDPSSALSEAQHMQGTSGDVDVAQQRADDALADVCHKYSLSKDFDISEHASNSMLH